MRHRSPRRIRALLSLVAVVGVIAALAAPGQAATPTSARC